MAIIPSDILKQLPSESLFSLMPDLGNQFLDFAWVKTFTKDQCIARKGEKLDHLYIPIDHDLLLKNDDDRFVSFLKRGRSLSLRSLLLNVPLQYDVLCDQSVKVLAFERKAFIDFLHEDPNQYAYLLNVTSFPSVREFKKLLEDLGVLSASLISLIAQIDIDAGESLDELKNKLGKDVIFVDQGQLRLTSLPSSLVTIDLLLTAPFYFGCEALVPPHQLSYDVESKDGLIFHTLSFEKILNHVDSKLCIEALYNEPFIHINEHTKIKMVAKIKTQRLGKVFDKTESLARMYSVDPKKLEIDLERKSHENVLVLAGVLFGKRIDPSEIEHFAKSVDHHLDLMFYAKICEQAGLHVRTFAFGKAKFNDRLPALAFSKDRCVLILKQDEKTCVVFDGHFGLCTWTQDQLNQAGLLEGLNLSDLSLDQKVVNQNDDQAVNEIKSPSLRHVVGFFKKESNLSLLVMASSALVFLMSLLPPWMSGKIVDDVLAVKDVRSIACYFVGLLLCYACITMLTWLRGVFLNQMSYLYDFEISSHFYRKTLELGKQFSKENRMGEVMSKMAQLGQIRDFVSSQMMGLMIEIVSVLVYVCILFYYSYQVALVPLLGMGMVFVLQFYFKKYLRKKRLKLFDESKDSFSKISEMISNIATLKAFGAEKKMLYRYEKSFLNAVSLERDLGLGSQTMQAMINLLTTAMQVICIWFGALLVFDQKISVGALFSLMLFVSKTIDPLRSISQFVSSLEDLKLSFDKVDEVYLSHEKMKKESSVKAMNFRSLKGKISLQNVSFFYEKDRPVLHDIDLTVFPKQTVGIVGASGSGKTTLAKLMAGQLLPKSGEIFYDDTERKMLPNHFLFSSIGWIHGKSELFSGTLQSNIAFGEVNIKEHRLMDSANKAQVTEFVSQFSTGFKQYLAEGGLGLSGGQRQRLTIARTLYQDPRILIFDEATSALDAVTEALFVEQFQTLLKDKTSIIIAHRLSTIRHCDVIYVLEDGRMVESGDHASLIQKQGVYHQLFKNQL